MAGGLYVSPLQSRVATKSDGFWIRYCGFVAIFLACVGLGQGFVRHRVKAIGYGVFFEFATVNKPSDEGFFKNCRFGKNLEAAQSQVAAVISAVARQRNKPEHDLNVYFGPRMQWAYAAFDLSSPRNLPVWWHPGVAFDCKDEGKYVQRWAERHFDVLIFFKGDASYMSQEFLSLIGSKYGLNDSLSHLSVMLPRSNAMDSNK